MESQLTPNELVTLVKWLVPLLGIAIGCNFFSYQIGRYFGARWAFKQSEDHFNELVKQSEASCRAIADKIMPR